MTDGPIPKWIKISLYKDPLEKVFRNYSMFRGVLSSHTRDLLVASLILILFLCLILWNEYLSGRLELDFLPDTNSSSDNERFKYYNEVLLAILGSSIAIAARIYQLGKRRFAAVDLISSEMVTVVRLMGIVGLADGLASIHKALSDDAIDPSEAHKSVAKLDQGSALPYESPSGFLLEEDYSDVFKTILHELGFLHSSTVDYVTDFYTFLKSLKEQKISLTKYFELAQQDPQSETVRANLKGNIELMLYTIDTMSLGALKAFDQLIEKRRHCYAAWRTVLFTALPANNRLMETIEREAGFHPLTVARRLEYVEVIRKIQRWEKSHRVALRHADEITY